MPYQPDPDLAAFIKSLPKTETHLHIEGALPFEFLQKIDPVQFKKPPRSWADEFKFQSFSEFEETLIAMALQWFTSPERYYEAAVAIFHKHLEQNVKYVEISFHAGIIEFLNIPGPEIIGAIRDAVPDGLEVRIFMGMLRNHYTQFMAPVIDDCVNWDNLDGIDLHGTEVLPLEDWAKSLWPRAREADKFTKAHAGEFGGAHYVKDAIELLGVNRVEHGVRAVEDPEVLSMIIEKDITFDVCPISNLKLNVIETMKNHPIRKLFNEGVRCTLNTDDPLSFGNQLEEESAVLAMELNFSEKELAILARNGFEIALMPESMKRPFIEQIDTIIGSN